MWKIYKHTFPNGKVYIGQTKQELQKRFKQGYGYEGCPLVWKAILKYGWNSVVTDVIEDNIVTLEETNEKECYYIKLYNSTNPNYGYNSAIGGGVVQRLDIDKILELWNQGYSVLEISDIMKVSQDAVTNNLKSMGISSEERKKRSYKKSGKENQIYDREKIMEYWNQGLAIIEISKKMECDRSVVERTLNENNISLEERKQRYKEYIQRSPTACNKKQIVQLTLDNEYIQTFSSIAEANGHLGKSPKASNIGQVCKGNRNQTYGFKWKYLTDYLNSLD